MTTARETWVFPNSRKSRRAIAVWLACRLAWVEKKFFQSVPAKNSSQFAVSHKRNEEHKH